MNLVWLKYVSYACLAGAVFFYMVLRLRRMTAISTTTKLAMLAGCIILACLTWHLQETNSEQHSPRQLIVGKVASVRSTTNKSGSINDKFQLTLDDGALSPSFTAEFVADNSAGQPIHPGDVLGVLYRTWDNVLVTADELQGQRPGWHYRNAQVLDPYVWTVGGAGFFVFLGALLGVLAQRRSAAASARQ